MPTFQTQRFINSMKEKGHNEESINSFLEAKGISSFLESEEITLPGQVNFLQRAKLSFGDKASRERRRILEEQAGLAGKLDIGDIADVVGGIPSLAGFILGGAGGAVVGGVPGAIAGAGVGAGAGEFTRQAVGRALGTAERFAPAEVAEEAVIGSASSIIGRVLGKAVKPVLRTAVVKPVKGVSRAISNFFFGVKGTTGFVARFRDPKGVQKFLTTARRRPGGKNVEDVVSLLNKTIGAVKKRSTDVFRKAEGEIISRKIPQPQIKSQSDKIIRGFLRIPSLKKETIARSGLNDTEVRITQRVAREIKATKDFTTKGVLTLRRTIDNLFRGTQAAPKSDALITQLRSHLNTLIEQTDPTFRTATQKFARDRVFLDKLGVNIVGKGKLSVDRTANKLFQLAKDLDNPFKREATEKLLVELEKRSGVPFIRTLRNLATAVNLAPQQAQGIRAGVVRELARALEVGISKVAGVAGRLKLLIPPAPPGTKKAAEEIERAAIFKILGGIFD